LFEIWGLLYLSEAESDEEDNDNDASVGEFSFENDASSSVFSVGFPSCRKRWREEENVFSDDQEDEEEHDAYPSPAKRPRTSYN